MQSITLHKLPDALRAVIEAQARLHQRSVEDEIQHMLEQAVMAVAPTMADEQEEVQQRNILKDLFDAIPPEARLTDEEAEMFSNIRHEKPQSSQRTE